MLSVFADGRLIPRQPVDDALLAADSWLVVDGTVRFLADHGRRFAAACVPAVAPDAVTAFWRAIVDALPRAGRWFPRVELSYTGELRLRMRTAPALGHRLAVWNAPPGDPRRLPRVKGPDLPALASLRAEAQRYGAPEALLASSEGWVIEGTTTSLLWWEDGTLCVPPDELPSLPGVTAARLIRRATALGIPVTRRYRTVRELAGREVWLVNALHGIRPVVGWTGARLRPGPVWSAPAWQAWLHRQARPLPTPKPPLPTPELS